MQYDLFKQQHNVPRETYDRLCFYHDLLQKWQKKINLISPQSIGDIWQRHLLDSLQLRTHIPDGSSILDIGSGAGLPAIPLTITNDQIRVTLVESDQRKAIFLEECKRQLTLGNITIVNTRIEDVPRETFALISARACAPLEKLLEWSSPFLSPNGKCLFPKGEQYAKEIEEASRLWSFDWEAIPSITHPKAAILSITHLAKR